MGSDRKPALSRHATFREQMQNARSDLVQLHQELGWASRLASLCEFGDESSTEGDDDDGDEAAADSTRQGQDPAAAGDEQGQASPDSEQGKDDEKALPEVEIEDNDDDEDDGDEDASEEEHDGDCEDKGGKKVGATGHKNAPKHGGSKRAPTSGPPDQQGGHKKARRT